MLPAVRRLILRLRRGLATPPGARGWRDTALALGFYAALAVPLASRADLVRFDGPPEWSAGLLLRLLILPALLEEIVFRGLLNPHPDERDASRPLLLAGLSLAVYVAAHPVAAWLWRPGAQAVFTDPVFLGLTALLGGAALVLYRRSGSLWGGVVLHWGVVAGWLGYGGLDGLGLG